VGGALPEARPEGSALTLAHAEGVAGGRERVGAPDVLAAPGLPVGGGVGVSVGVAAAGAGEGVGGAVPVGAPESVGGAAVRVAPSPLCDGCGEGDIAPGEVEAPTLPLPRALALDDVVPLGVGGAGEGEGAPLHVAPLGVANDDGLLEALPPPTPVPEEGEAPSLWVGAPALGEGVGEAPVGVAVTRAAEAHAVCEAEGKPPEGVGEPVAVAVAQGVGGGDAVAHAVAVALQLPPPIPPPSPPPAQPPGEGEGDAEGEGVPVAHPVPVALTVPEGDARGEPEANVVPLGVPLTEALTESVAEAQLLRDAPARQGVTLPVGEVQGDAEAGAEAVGVTEPEPLAVAHARPDFVAEGEPLAVAQARPDLVAEGEPLLLRVGKPLRLPQGEGLPDGVPVRAAEGEGEPVGESDALRLPQGVALPEGEPLVRDERLSVVLPEGHAVPLVVPDCRAEVLPLPVGDALPKVPSAEEELLRLADAVAEGDCEACGECEDEKLQVAVVLSHREALNVIGVVRAEKVGWRPVPHAEEVRDARGVALVLALRQREGLPLPLRLAEAQPLEEALARALVLACALRVPEPLPEALRQAEGEAEGEPVGRGEPVRDAVAQVEAEEVEE
jgi:hypothetical protein